MKATAEKRPAPTAPQRGMPPCPECGSRPKKVTNFCSDCGADLRGVGGETDTLVGADITPLIDGRYKIQSKLGEGGMGSVFRVEHVRMGKVCALKLLREDLLGGSRASELRERFRQEARIVSRLVHVNTIQVFDFGETGDGALYLVMEYLRGRSLDTVLRDAGGRLEEVRAARIAIQVLRSLAEAHEAGIVHRDIKPANVMLLDLRDRKDFVKVLDFGIAKLTENRGGRRSETAEGELVGTPNYLSPEQARGESLDARSDLYSLGAMLFEMLSGRAPYVAETPLGVATAHITRPVPRLREVAAAGVSADMENILLRAMAKDPADRFQSADELRAALEALIDAGPQATGEVDALPLGGDTESMVAVRADFERFARRLIFTRFLKALVPLLLVGAAAGAGYAWWQQPAPPLSAESEPNDIPKQAGLVTPDAAADLEDLARRHAAAGRPGGLRTVEGHLGKRISTRQGDVDWYRLEVPGPDPMSGLVAVSGIPNIDLKLELLREREDSPGQLGVHAVSDARGVGMAEALPNLRLAPGTWMIQVREVQVGDEDGRLGLPVENVSDPYQLVVALRPADGDIAWEVEPNDKESEAGVLALGVPRSGLAGVAGAVDVWMVEVPEGRSLAVQVSGVEQVAWRLEVFAERSAERGRRRPDAREDARTGADASALAAVEGRAFIRVVVREGENLFSPYRIIAEDVDPPRRR